MPNGIAQALGGFSAGLQGNGAQYSAMLDQREMLDREKRMQNEALSKDRLTAMVKDSYGVKTLLEGGKTDAALKLLKNRIDHINKLGGDPADTKAVYDQLVSGDPTQFAAAQKTLTDVVDAGVAGGLWAPPQKPEDTWEGKKFKAEQDVRERDIELKERTQDWKEKNPDAGVQRADQSSANIREIEYYNRMPEGPAKEAAGRKLGMFTDANGLSPDAIELAADRLLNGEPSRVVLANFGRGAQGAADLRAVQNRLAVKAKEGGIDATKLLQNTQNVYADNRTFLELGAREGKIATRVQEANLFADIALKASKEVPRESFVPWNKLSQYTSKQLSDPKLAALHAATQSLVNAYASAVGGGVMTEGNRLEANRMLYDAQGPEAYNAVVNQMLIETQAALDSPKQVRKHMHGETDSHDKPKQNVKWDELP